MLHCENGIDQYSRLRLTVEMKRYLELAVISFAICALLSVTSFVLIYLDMGYPPGEAKKIVIGYTYFSLNGAYFASFQAIVRDVLARQGKWADPWAQCLGVPLIGASLGLLLLGWIALLVPKGWQASELLTKAELLDKCHMVLENCVQYASILAVLAVVGTCVYDMSRPVSEGLE